MKFAIICEDLPNSEDLRKATRDQHLSYLSQYEVSLAGPMLSDDQSQMIGSIIILEVADLPAAEAFAAADPYKLAGLFERVTIRPFKQAIPSAG